MERERYSGYVIPESGRYTHNDSCGYPKTGHRKDEAKYQWHNCQWGVITHLRGIWSCILIYIPECARRNPYCRVWRCWIGVTAPHPSTCTRGDTRQTYFEVGRSPESFRNSLEEIGGESRFHDTDCDFCAAEGHWVSRAPPSCPYSRTSGYGEKRRTWRHEVDYIHSFRPALPSLSHQIGW